MYRATPEQRHAQRGCHTCEANITCQWCKGIAQSDRSLFICRNYTNRGKDQNGDKRPKR